MPDTPDHKTSATILFVDDEAELRFIVSEYLRSAGYRVIEAHDGPQAVDAARQHHPDIIIMDIGLPNMDGITVTRLLKENPQTASIPVIMLTARSGSQDVVKGLEAGAQEYLSKPFDLSELLARVRAVHRLSTTQQDLDKLNIHLEAQVDTKANRLRYLYEYMRELNLAESKNRILDLIVGCCEQTTRAKRISLFIQDNNKEHLVCERAIGLDASTIEPLPISDMGEITNKVFRSGKMLAVNTYGGKQEDKSDYESNSFLSTPIISTSLNTHDGIIGVLNVTDKQDRTSFDEEEIKCVQSIADAAAIALDNLVRQQQLEQSVKMLLNTVGLLAEYRDEETTQHIERVSRLSKILAEEVKREGPYAYDVTDEFIAMLVQAAPMHDIGKVGIADDILTKPGKLTDEEYNIMKMHTEIGRRVLSHALDPDHPGPLLQMCIDIAYSHHEKWNGQGYPQRISGRNIPLSARMIALVDAYDAMRSHRRYKSAITHEDAIKQIQESSGQHFDPNLVEAFMRCHERFDEVHAQCVDETHNVLLSV